MRNFRYNRVNLRDTRIAYTFLLALALVCAIMGILTTSLSARLHSRELADCRASLEQCSDALHEYGAAATSEARYAAAIRFTGAVAALPAETELSPLLSLAEDMRSGSAERTAVRALEDTFTLLAALDYVDNAQARATIAETLGGVGEALKLTVSEPESESSEDIPPEVVAYSRGIAERGIELLFGSTAGSIAPVLSDDGSTLIAENGNLRMTFSAKDGALEGFVYIRFGDVPKEARTESERLSSALEFFNLNRRHGKGTDVSAAGELCGFLLADITAGDEYYRAAVDSYGRVWSLFKVKR